MKYPDKSFYWPISILENLRKDFLLKWDSDPTEHEFIEPLVEKYQHMISSGESITKLLLHVTEKCFLKCSYCYITEAPGYKPNIDILAQPTERMHGHESGMTWPTAKKSIDRFYALIRKTGQGKVHVRFHGGEPLIKYDLICQCIRYICKNFADVRTLFHMNTNGMLIDTRKADFFAMHNIDIEISIDGPQEVHDSVRHFADGKGSFTGATNSVKILLDAGLSVDQINIATTLHKYNINQLDTIVDIAQNLGIQKVEINTLIFQSIFDVADVESKVNALLNARLYGITKGVSVSGKWFKLFERLKDPVLNYCGRIGQQIGINPLGKIILCTGYMVEFGDISDFDAVFANGEYIKKGMRIVGNIEGCRGCSIEGMCAGGCPAAAEKCYGSFYLPERKECEFRRQITKVLLCNIDKTIGSSKGISEIDSSYVPTMSSLLLDKRRNV